MTEGAVIVTGAGGFVCSEICAALARRGLAVVAVDRMFDGPARTRLRAIPLVEGALPQVLAEVADRSVGAVIHGAAITASPHSLGLTRSAHIRRNVEMHIATLDWARTAGAGRFLFLSSMGVFEPDDGPGIGGRFTEATGPTADCAYCAAKRAGEILTEAAAEPGFSTLSLRLGNIFGPNEAARETRQILCLVSRMTAEARATGVINVGTPEASREWAWLPDLADGIAVLIEQLAADGPSLLHAGAPPIATDLSVARAIADRLGGTTIRIAKPPNGTIRPPMASACPSPFDEVDWTPMEQALDILIPAGDAS